MKVNEFSRFCAYTLKALTPADYIYILLTEGPKQVICPSEHYESCFIDEEAEDQEPNEQLQVSE